MIDGRRVMNALHGEQHRKTIMNIDETKLEYRVISESGLVYRPSLSFGYWLDSGCGLVRR